MRFTFDQQNREVEKIVFSASDPFNSVVMTIPHEVSTTTASPFVWLFACFFRFYSGAAGICREQIEPNRDFAFRDISVRSTGEKTKLMLFVMCLLSYRYNCAFEIFLRKENYSAVDSGEKIMTVCRAEQNDRVSIYCLCLKISFHILGAVASSDMSLTSVLY